MGIIVNLVDKTVKNTGTEDISIKELIEKISTIAPDATHSLDPNTVGFEV